MLSSLKDRFLNSGMDAVMSAEERRLLRFHRGCIVGLLWIGPLFAAWGIVAQQWVVVVPQVISTSMYVLALIMTLRGKHIASKILYLGAAVGISLFSWWSSPGMSQHLWFLLTMTYPAAVFRGDQRRLRFGFILLSGALFIMGAFDVPRVGLDLPGITEQTQGNVRVVTELSVALALGFLVSFMAEQMRLAESQLEEEHRKSEGLLHNILPKPIAERLKRNPNVIADGFPQVTVLFSDIVGFTPMSAKLSPKELVGVLNVLFTGFDQIASKYGLEKIKTIGDAYMVAAGVPAPSVRHAHDVAAMALEMREFALEYGGQLDPPVSIRIGIHSGPVVAGVIGQSKFAYDLWGDTVNTASRMESGGQPGRIHVSQSTHDLLADEFVLECRGEIEVKGKGAMTTWFLVERAA